MATVLILGTPIVALLGGILASILRVRGEHRLMELAQRERIAAIEKGIDISQWAPPSLTGRHVIYSTRDARLRKVHGLIIGGLVSVALGIGIALTLSLMPPHDGGDSWPIGIVPTLIGGSLLLAARIIRKGLDEES